MNVEKTIEFLLENQARLDARMEASFVRSEARFAKAEKRLDRIERLVTQLASAGLRFRNEIRRAQLDTERQTKVLADKLNTLADRHAETEGKLDALIDVVDRIVRRDNGAKR